MDGRQPDSLTLARPTTEALPPHALPAEAVLDCFATDPERGLSERQTETLRAQHGVNELAEAPAVPLWQKLLAQFKELVVWILLVAAVLSALTGEWADALAILAIVVLNAVLGFFQEEKAERALAALQRLSAPLAKVLRDGLLRTVPARELVPGDCIELEAGDNIPADARLVRAIAFRVQEAALTGESEPEDKDPACVLNAVTPLGDRRNMVYMGTVAAAGTSEFAKEFTARGPFDARGRTLRAFDLRSRMFRHPLSYLIYSREFDGLPAEARERVYLRLWGVLSGKDQSKPFAHLAAADRQAVLKILRETKKDLPAYWKN